MDDNPRPEDEFDSLVDVAAELSKPFDPSVIVSRIAVETVGPTISAITWGLAPPQAVFLHGGGQNAHTWDLVCTQLGRPAIAIDLPGHGHSAWRADHDYRPFQNASTISTVLEQLAPRASVVVGMSLGGLTLISLAATRPDLVRRAVLVDITPWTEDNVAKLTPSQRGAVALVDGPRTFASQERMVANALTASPHRLPAAVRRGVHHNSTQLADGSWTWRYDPERWSGDVGHADRRDALGMTTMPMMLVTGADSPFVTSINLEQFTRTRPDARVVSVEGAGHAVQSDRPKELARLIQDFTDE